MRKTGQNTWFRWGDTSSVDLWSLKTLKSLMLPGGILLLAASVVFRAPSDPFPTLPSAFITTRFSPRNSAGLALSLQPRSVRAATLAACPSRSGIFFRRPDASAGPGRIALEAVAFLLPLNFIVFSVSRERELVLPPSFPGWRSCSSNRFLLPSSAVPGETTGPAFLHSRFLGNFPWTPNPTLALLAFRPLSRFCCRVFLLTANPRRAVCCGRWWRLFFFSGGGVGPAATAYVATAA